MSILLDAGPLLNFLAVGQQNILVQLAVSRNLQLAAPERVDAEVRGMARAPRFAGTGVLNTWTAMTTAGRIKILNDSIVDRADLAAAVARVSGLPADERIKNKASLGEILVLAHTSVFAQQGQRVYVLIDERDGRARAIREIRWLLEHDATGGISLWMTPNVLRQAEPGWIAKGKSWEQVYDEMTAYDDGLPPRPPS